MSEDTWEAEVLWPLEYERAKEAAVEEATARVRGYWESKLEQMSKANRRLSLMKDRREAERDSLAQDLAVADKRTDLLAEELEDALAERDQLRTEAATLRRELAVLRPRLRETRQLRDKYQAENRELRQRLQALGGGGQ